MEANEYDGLFYEVVGQKVYDNGFGTISIPLEALREFHDVIELDAEQPFMLNVVLKDAEAGLFNYEIGVGTDEDLLIELVGTSFYDCGAGKAEPIVGGTVLEKAMVRKFCTGESLICGVFALDQLGRLYARTIASDCLMTDFRIDLASSSVGFSVIKAVFTESYHMWIEDDTFYVTPSKIFYCDGLPS